MVTIYYYEFSILMLETDLASIKQMISSISPFLPRLCNKVSN